MTASGSPKSSPPGYELPVYDRLDVEIVEGDGVHVRTADGRELIDFYGGHAVAALGYRHPRLVAALAGQAERLFFQTNLVDVAVRRAACEALGRFAPDGLEGVFLVNSGAEANENALRIACKVTGRPRIVALTGGFHGRTAAAAAATSGAHGKWYGFPRTPFDVTFVAPDDERALRAAVGPDVAAVILEPVLGLAGARDLSPSFLVAARDATAKAGALLIADEVQSGMGRSGRAFAIEYAGVTPDLLTTAKGLAGGFPAGALLATEAIASSLKVGDLGTTFGGGPIACVLISTVIDVVGAPGFLEHVREMESLIRATCRIGPVTSIQGRGLLLGLRTEPPAKAVVKALLGRGILAGGSSDPHVMRLMPPLVVDAGHIAQLARALEGLTP